MRYRAPASNKPIPPRDRAPLAGTFAAAFCTTLLLGASTLAAPPAQARAITHRLDIPSQELSAALKAFGAAANEQILFSDDVVAGLLSTHVKGEFSTDEAIAVLLKGSGLKADRTPSGVLLIRAPLREGEIPTQSTSAPDARKTTSRETGFWSRLRLAQADGSISSSGSYDSATGSEGPQRSAERSPWQEDKKAPALEEVVVNARNPQQTLVQGAIPRIETGALPISVISREDILRSGATTASELLRDLPQNFQRGTNVQRGALTGNTRDNSVDLRGFGVGQTVTLINDRRVGSSEGGGANTMAIPLAAVERVEVLSGASSAIYGANALGGVVNYVLRNDFSGAEVSAYFSNTTSGNAADKRISFIVGDNWLNNRLNVLLSAETGKGNALLQRDRDYIDRLIARTLERNPNAIFGAPPLTDAPANIRAIGGTLGIPGSDATFASVPAGATGVNEGPAAYQSTAGQYNLAREYGIASKSAYLKAPNEDFKSFFQTVFAINSSVAVFAEHLYVRSLMPKSANPGGIPTAAATVPATNPYNPFGRPVQIGATPIDFDPWVRADSTSNRYVAGVKGTFGDTWKWSADLARWDETNRFTTYGPRTVAFNAALASSDPATAYNPFADLRVHRPNSPELLATLSQLSENDISTKQDTVGLRASGELFSVLGKPLRSSFGYEFRDFKGGQLILVTANNVVTPTLFSPFDRKVDAGFLELSLPIISAGDGIPMVSSLEIDGAYRYEKYRSYSEPGRNGLVGLKWEFTPGIAVRAAVGTGFFPPTTFQLTPSATGPILIGPNLRQDPRRNNEFIVGAFALTGGNPDLLPESADYLSYGLVLNPPDWGGFLMTVDIYRLDKDDAIVNVNDLQILANEALFPGRVTRGPNLPGDPPGYPGPVTFIDSRAANASKLNTTGVDVSIVAPLPWRDFGRWTLRADYTEVTRFERQTIPGQPVLDLINNPLGGGVLRANGVAGINWAFGTFAADLNASYTSSYNPSNPTVEGSRIPSMTELNLLLNYTVPKQGSDSGLRGWLDGTQWSVGVHNLTDRDPPFEITSGYSLYSDPRQRWFHFRVTKGF